MGDAKAGSGEELLKDSADDGGRYDDVEDIGELYDHVGIYLARRDVDFYVGVAREVGGRVLELGCGTGRVLIPIARAGLPITGVDRSPAMLRRCRETITREPREVRERVTLIEGDMRSFEAPGRFDLAIAPFRGVQHLLHVEDQERWLRQVRLHLRPGGRLVFDVFNPDPARLARPQVEESEDTPWTPLDGNRTFRRAARVVAIDREAQVSSVELCWYVRGADGNEQRRVQAFPMRWFERDEIAALVERSGFIVREILGTLDRAPYAPGAPEIVVVADRAE